MPNEETRDTGRLPDFILGGAMKSATSSLHHILRRHDSLHLPPREIHFFCQDDPVQHPDFFFPVHHTPTPPPDYDRDVERNLDWYRRLFEPASTDQLVGDYSTIYLASERAPERIRDLVPEAKLVFLLRNPTDRTYSHYWHRVKTGRSTHSFEHELQHGPSTLFLRSYYKPQLERYLDLFPPSQIKVVLFEQFVNDTQTTVEQVCSFLGLDESVDLGRVDAHKNKSPVPRFPGLQRLMNYMTKGLEQQAPQDRPGSQQSRSSWVIDGAIHHLRKLNMAPGTAPPMDQAVRARLDDIFGRVNRGLSDLIDPNPEQHWDCLSKADSRSRN